MLRILSKSHGVKILDSLNEEPQRFVDLEEICNSSRTRTMRLKEFKSEGLVEAIPKMSCGRAYTFYTLTPTGKRALELAKMIFNLPKRKESSAMEK